MGQRLLPSLAVALVLSLLLNLVQTAFFFLGTLVPPAYGAAGSATEGFVMATEHSSDQTPTCFVLSTQKPHLLVYKTDTAGQLQLTSARDIECDLRARDVHFPRRQAGQKYSTLPPVRDVCKAVHDLEKKEKKAPAKDEEEEGENGEKTQPKKDKKETK
jgi:hypothetical protein